MCRQTLGTCKSQNRRGRRAEKDASPLDLKRCIEISGQDVEMEQAYLVALVKL
jgi:hypothetical protein